MLHPLPYHRPAFTKMAGVTVDGEFFAFDCEEINLQNKKLGEAALLPLLESFSRGEFTRLNVLSLVIASACGMMPALSHACYSEWKRNWR